MKFLLCFALLFSLTGDKSCQNKVEINRVDATHNPLVEIGQLNGTVVEQGGATAPCQPLILFFYDDNSGSVNDANSRVVKEQFITGLEKSPDACIKTVRLLRFGVASVWTTLAQEYHLPLQPYCAPEPDYNQLPPTARNLEVWREKLRYSHQIQCSARKETFRRAYGDALATLKAALLKPIAARPDQVNSCTSFGNLLRRVSIDVRDETSERIMVVSDLAWTCREQVPDPTYVSGVIIQVTNGGTDDRIRTSPDKLAPVFKRVLPNVSILQGINAERAVETLVSAGMTKDVSTTMAGK